MEEFAARPRPGEVYNIGGGRDNSISIIEVIKRIEKITGRLIDCVYHNQNRKGDHICYISDLTKFKSHYPSWTVTRDLDTILEQMIDSQMPRLAKPA